MTKTVAAVRVPTPREAPSASHPVNGAGFTLNLPNFEGPFDLLLTLITRRKLDITDIALAEVTDEFLEYLHTLYAEGTERALDESSDFIVTAATLLELKAARLLPQDRESLEQDVALLEARDLLFARLLQYRAYREVAAIFSDRWREENKRFPRTVALEPVFVKALPELVFTGGAEEFARIAIQAFTPKPEHPEQEPSAADVAEELNEHLHAATTTIAQEEQYILDALLAGMPAVPSVMFSALLRDAQDLDVAVVRFLALLELYQEGAVDVVQDAPLAGISVQATERARGFVPVDPEVSLPAGEKYSAVPEGSIGAGGLAQPTAKQRQNTEDNGNIPAKVVESTGEETV